MTIVKAGLRLLVLMGMIFNTCAATETDEESIKRYLEAARKEGRLEAAEVFETPEIYGITALDGQSVPPTGQEKPNTPEPNPADADKSKHPSLSLFGYDLFDAPSSEFFVPSETPVPANYVLGPGDQIIVNLWGRVEKTFLLTIDREGKVFIPKAGEITLWGATPKDAEARLTKFLSKIYSEFELSLILGKIKSIKVYVYGEVKKPGAYTVSSLATLFNVLYLSGGPAENGSLRRIQLSRSGGEVVRVDLYDLLLHGRNSDIRLDNNDVIFVPIISTTAAIKGQVKRPAIYELLGDETMSDLIALAGGLKPDAYLERVLVSRIENNSCRVLIDVNLADGQNEADIDIVHDGDMIEVFSIHDFQEKFVRLEGRVKYPGSFEFKPGMRVTDLIDDGNRLLIDSYRDRANIIRTYEDQSKRLIPVDLNLALAGDKTANLELIDRDRLIVYYERDIRRIPYVTIEGKVKREETFELTRDMRLSDVIFLAGGIEKEAYRLGAEIARTNGGTVSKIIQVELDSCLTHPGGEHDLLLHEDDRIFIREIPEWKIHDLVQIEGEVRFPGRYALQDKNEKLTDLVERAGGFTDQAFLRGAVFERESITKDIQRRNLTGIMENLQAVTLDSLKSELQKEQMLSLRTGSMNRIVIDMEKLFQSGDHSQNIELRNGDRIYIPEIPSGVHVLGAVASSGTIKYIHSKDYSYYIKTAGGLAKSADKGEIRIVKPDGRVFHSGLSRIKIEIGDSIIIPKRLENDRDWWKIFSGSAAIVSSAVTTVFLITKL